MRSLMLALGACLFALNFAGCSSTGSCSSGQGLLCGGNVAGNMGCSECADSSCGCSDMSYSSDCGDSSCSGGCGNSGCAAAFTNRNYGGQSGLGLGLMEAGPSCKTLGCQGGCRTCQIRRPQLAKRVAGRIASRGCGCGAASDCGCEAPEPTPAENCGCSTPAPALPETSGCGCSDSLASGPVEFSMGDLAETEDCGCEAGLEESDVQLASHDDRRGLLRGIVGRAHQAHGCGVRGCGGPAGLCGSCLSRLRGGAGSIPHRDPSIHGGGMAGPAGQIPTYAYPYYTTRAPRDFLDPNPPTIGY